MRTSRVAKETSRFFDASSAPVPPRRSTRVSLARFAYNATNGTASSTASDDLEDSKVTIGSDIEDAVKTETTRKRKRTATVVQPSPRRASTRTKTVKTEVKSEIKSEIKTEIEPKIKSEIKSEPNSDSEPEETNPKPRGRVRKPARKTTDASTGTTTIQPPSDWQEIYSLVKEMRLTGPAANAAVDTMGCERLADADATPRDRRFQTLVALMLSSQTKDTVNAEAMARLKAELPPHMPGAKPGLNLENMLAVEPALLNELIGKVGFHNNKTK
jgi:endonuclease-3